VSDAPPERSRRAAGIAAGVVVALVIGALIARFRRALPA
jgi:tetrahydromethanopterin S-methyltransferase subunit F